jgi:Transposase DDE domain group 1
MTDPLLPLAGLSPVGGKAVVARFDGGLLSSDGGVLALREVERRLGVAERLAACLTDPRAPAQITHSLADIVRFRLLLIAAGYEDGNDADRRVRPRDGDKRLEPDAGCRGVPGPRAADWRHRYHVVRSGQRQQQRDRRLRGLSGQQGRPQYPDAEFRRPSSRRSRARCCFSRQVGC